MKKILILAALLFATNAASEATTNDLMGLGMPAELASRVSVMGQVMLIGEDANRKFTFGAASDTAHTLQFGDAGTTAVQTLTISASTADADDDATLQLGFSSGTRGAGITLPGEEVAGGSDITYNAGTSDSHTFQVAGATVATLDAGGIQTSGVRDFVGVAGGSTLAIQEAVAGTSCSGTLNANGATPVVTSTSCATTGSRIFLQRTSAETAAVEAWISALSNGVSFSVTGEAADTGSYNWFIVHEAP